MNTSAVLGSLAAGAIADDADVDPEEHYGEVERELLKRLRLQVRTVCPQLFALT
mgnify:CR=1 FL=1